jgi:hypothetical protein
VVDFRVMALCGLVLACGSECKEERCATVDRGPRDGDLVIALDTESAFVVYEVEGFEANAGLPGGQIVFTTNEPSCIASSNRPCRLTLHRLRLELSSMVQPTTDGDVDLDDPVLTVETPVELVDLGSGFVLEPGVNVQTCVSVNGRSSAATDPLEAPVTLTLDFANRTSVLEGTLPVAYSFGSDECVLQRATATITAAGVSPWAEGS